MSGTAAPVAFTFEAGGDDAPLAGILSTLERARATATFFLDGRWAEARAEVVVELAQAGHELANHGYAHQDWTGLSDSEIERDLAATEQLVNRLTGRSSKPWARPPYGALDERVNTVLARTGYAPFYRNAVDGVHWPGQTTTESVEKRALRAAEREAVVVFHTNRPETEQALPAVLEALEREGRQVVVLSALEPPPPPLRPRHPDFAELEVASGYVSPSRPGGRWHSVNVLELGTSAMQEAPARESLTGSGGGEGLELLVGSPRSEISEGPHAADSHMLVLAGAARCELADPQGPLGYLIARAGDLFLIPAGAECRIISAEQPARRWIATVWRTPDRDLAVSDDLIILGNVLTMDRAHPHAEGVAIADGRITRVGARRELLETRVRGVEVIDAGEATVLPGFYDAHLHQVYAGLRSTQVDARVNGMDDLVERIRAAAAQAAPGAWIEGSGWDEHALAEARPPTRDDLDLAVGDRPVFVTRTCGHVMVPSSAALAASGIRATTPDPAGGQIDRDPVSGEPNGIIRERAMELVRRVVPLPSPAAIEDAILAAAKRNLSLGITSLWEPSVEPDHVAAYRRLEQEGRLPLRVTMAQKRVLRSGERVPVPEPFRSPRLSLVAVKIFQDGALAPRTASLSAPYEGEADNLGLLIWPQHELDAMVREIHQAGLQASIHAIGDAAIGSALEAIEKAQLGSERRLRHRIEHCGLPLGTLPERLGRAGVTPVLQPIFIRFHGDNYARNVGRERSELLYPTRTLLESCPIVAGSSDAPVVPDHNPLLGVQTAITRETASGTLVAPAESVSLEDALHLYTTGAAAAAGEESWKGRLAHGCAADVIVLDADIERVGPSELAEVRVSATFLDGVRCG